MIDRLLEQCIIEAITNNKYPASIIRDYFDLLNSPWNYSHFEAMCGALSNIQVRNKNPETNEWEFINGFMPLEDFYD